MPLKNKKVIKNAIYFIIFPFKCYFLLVLQLFFAAISLKLGLLYYLARFFFRTVKVYKFSPKKRKEIKMFSNIYYSRFNSVFYFLRSFKVFFYVFFFFVGIINSSYQVNKSS